MRFLRLEEEYWFRAVFCFYDSKRSIGFVWFFYDSKRSIGFVWFLRLEEEYWFRMVFLVLVFFRPFDLGHFHWRRFIGGREFVSHFIQTSFTLLEKHFKFKAISSKNQRTKRKDRAMK